MDNIKCTPFTVGGPSTLLRCQENKVIKKYGPAASLINEYISSKIVARILGSQYNNSISISVDKDNKVYLEISMRDSFIPSSEYKGTPFISGPFINNIPAASMIGFCQIGKDFTGFTVSTPTYSSSQGLSMLLRALKENRLTAPPQYEVSRVGNKPILNFFTSHLATLIVHDTDHGGLFNFALTEFADSYGVLPFDFDGSLSFLYNLQPPLIKRKPISALYPPPLVDRMFNEKSDGGISQASLVIPLIGNFIDISSGSLLEQHSAFPRLAQKMLDIYLRLDLLPLESAFISALKTPFNELAQEIDHGFAHVKNILPANLVSAIYEKNAIRSVTKRPFYYYAQNFKSADNFISLSDINKSVTVAQYCKAIARYQEVLTSLNHIVKCYVGIMHASLNGLALCYIALKFIHSQASDSERLKVELLSLPTPWTNHECFHPNILAPSRCASSSDSACIQDSPPVKICDIYPDFPICTGLDVAAKQDVEVEL